MLCWLLHQLRYWLKDVRLRRAAQRYQAQLKVIETLPLPEHFKQAAKELALNKIGEKLEQYADPE